MKYKYKIKIHLAKTNEELESILNNYGNEGYRVFRVEKTDHCIYEGGACKYTIYLEQKIKNEQSANKHNKNQR
jgi:hypothetical protein